MKDWDMKRLNQERFENGWYMNRAAFKTVDGKLVEESPIPEEIFPIIQQSYDKAVREQYTNVDNQKPIEYLTRKEVIKRDIIERFERELFDAKNS